MAGLMRERSGFAVVAKQSGPEESQKRTTNITFERTASYEVGVDLFFGPGPAGFDGGGDAAAGTELAADDGPNRIAGFHHVFKDLVDDVFLKDAEVAVAEKVLLEGFQLEAAFAGHVADIQHAEVGQACLGANGSKLGVVNRDFVGWELILPGLDSWKSEVEAGFCVIVGVTRLRSHVFILRAASQGLSRGTTSIFLLP